MLRGVYGKTLEKNHRGMARGKEDKRDKNNSVANTITIYLQFKDMSAENMKRECVTSQKRKKIEY